MDNLAKWHLQYGNNNSPCFVTNVVTEELLYVNEKLLQLFALDQSILGKKFHNVIVNDNAMYEEIQPDWNKTDKFETVVFNKKTNQQFYGTSILLDDPQFMFCELRPYENEEGQNPFEEAMTRCMEIYQQPTETILLSFMELLCNFYHCERAYVYRFNRDDLTINCVSQWCKDPKFRVTQEVGERLNASFLIDWIQNSSESGILTANVESEDFDEDSTIAQVMGTFQMKNLTLCTVEDANREVVGFVGLSNRVHCDKFFDRRVINAISHFVAQDVAKEVIDATLFQLHHRDTLTGFYNRAGYSKKMDIIMENQPHKMGVLSVNINGLKVINENSGITGGDRHIKTAANRLKDHFDCHFFRMSGDEFVGIIPDIEKDLFESNVVNLHTTMRAEGNYDFSLGHAWGMGAYDLAKLQLEADTVMYINKQEYYSASQRHFDSVNDHTLSDLLSYLAAGEFMIYLQPQVRLKDGSLYGAEALIRRFDKTNQKMVFPDQFISIYEQKSVIRHVDIFVVETVCQLLEIWVKKGRSIPVSVNLSRVTLQEYGIVSTIVRICDKYQVPHHLLVIEVTERVGLIENNVASSLITDFKNNGFNISLDDFGCAYSNIVTLSQIEVDEVKIDKSLVDDLTTSKKNHILVKNVLSMCNELDGASTLAEGIEDEEQAKLLHQLGCHLGQGYFYSRPIPVAEFCEKYIDVKEEPEET